MAFLGLWKLYVTVKEVPTFMLPPPESIALKFFKMIIDGTLLKNGWITLYSIIIGFTLGSFLGFVAGYFSSRSKMLEDVTAPYVMLIQSTPKISLIPLFVIWFGLGITSKLLLIILSAFFPLMVNTITGFRSIPKEYYELITILRGTRKQSLFKMELPLAMPIIIAGSKVAMVQSVIGAIVSEWIAGEQGLGYLLVYGSVLYDANLLIAAILATAFLGVFLYSILNFVEQKLLFWHESRIIITEGA